MSFILLPVLTSGVDGTLHRLITVAESHGPSTTEPVQSREAPHGNGKAPELVPLSSFSEQPGIEPLKRDISVTLESQVSLISLP